MDSLLFLIESKLGSLPDSERKIAEYIMREKKNVMYQRVNEIAAEAGASTSAVMRLCKSLGIPGFQEMKIMLARDVYGAKPPELGEPREQPDNGSSAASRAAMIIESNIDGLKDLEASIDVAAIERAAELIDSSSYLFSFGLGLSSSIAFDFYHKMERLGYLCGFAQDAHMQIITASNMGKGMTGMVVSHSGITADVVKATRLAKANGASMITISGNPHGDVADLCDVVLVVPFSEPLQRLGASSTRIAQLTIIDIIFSELIRRHPTRSIDNLRKTSMD